MSSEPVLSLRDVGKYYEIYQNPRHRLWQFLWRDRKKFYREFWAVADINLEVAAGECVGIIGRNGAGKSTLLQLIAGTLNPSHGAIKVNGRLAALLELGSGFNPDFTGRENVYLNAAILGLSKREIDSRFEKIVEFADIGEFLDRPVKTYSSGMALRLAFAVIANADADILIIDEALAVGDAFFTQKCMRFLRDFIATHTVILVSHDTNAICSLCTRAVLMEEGRISQVGTPKEIAQKYLEKLYAATQGEEHMHLQASPSEKSKPESAADFPLRDMRQDMFNSSNLRNDLQIFPFPLKDQGFGTGKGIITSVRFSDQEGKPYRWIVGGEIVSLEIICQCNDIIEKPIIGFLVVNSKGLQLFGDNTWLSHAGRSLPLYPGDVLKTVFTFQMPIMAPGEYHITAALGEGTPADHVQHHWIHEAITFSAEASPLATGLMGVPMMDIVMEKQRTGRCQISPSPETL